MCSKSQWHHKRSWWCSGNILAFHLEIAWSRGSIPRHDMLFCTFEPTGMLYLRGGFDSVVREFFSRGLNKLHRGFTETSKGVRSVAWWLLVWRLALTHARPSRCVVRLETYNNYLWGAGYDDENFASYLNFGLRFRYTLDFSRWFLFSLCRPCTV